MACRHQGIIWTNVGTLSIGPVATNFGVILIEIETFPLKNAFEYVVRKMAAILSFPADSVLIRHIYFQGSLFN